MAAYAVIALVTMVVSGWWGISLHAAGVSLPWCVGFLTVGPDYLPGLIVVAAVGWARVYLREHSVGQVVTGGLLGVTAAFLAMALGI